MATKVSLLQKDIIPYNRVHTAEATSAVYLFFTACITNRPILFLPFLPLFPISYLPESTKQDPIYYLPA